MSFRMRRRLHEARPSYREIRPLIYYINIVYGVMNILLAVSFTLLQDNTPLIITRGIFDLNFWATVWAVLGSYMLYAAAIDDWITIRRAQILALLTKSVWLIALSYLTIGNISSMYILVLWLMITLIQGLCVVFFMPTIQVKETDG